MDKSHQGGRDEGSKVNGGISGFGGGGQQAGGQDLASLRNENDLLYPQPLQNIRGAGSGPGLAGGARNTPGIYDGNTSVAQQVRPIPMPNCPSGAFCSCSPHH